MTPTTYGRDFAYCLKSHGGVRGFYASLWRFLLRCTLFCHSVATFLTSVSSYEGGCGFEVSLNFPEKQGFSLQGCKGKAKKRCPQTKRSLRSTFRTLESSNIRFLRMRPAYRTMRYPGGAEGRNSNLEFCGMPIPQRFVKLHRRYTAARGVREDSMLP